MYINNIKNLDLDYALRLFKRDPVTKSKTIKA